MFLLIKNDTERKKISYLKWLLIDQTDDPDGTLSSQYYRVLVTQPRKLIAIWEKNYNQKPRIEWKANKSDLVYHYEITCY